MSSSYGYSDDNGQKTPLALSLHRLGEAKSQDRQQLVGKSLPCRVKAVVSPWIVTVEFAVASQPYTLQPVTVPVLAPPYVAYPIQVGDAGRFISSDHREGALSGLGAGVPSLNDVPGNLSCGGFVWLGNTAWTTPDPDAVVTWGNLVVGQSQLAFFGGAKVSRQDVTGALSSVTDPAAKAVLTSLIDALANYALITNGTS